MEKWKDRIMNSLDGMEKVSPPADTFSQIQNRIAAADNEASNSYNWLAIASVILLMICSNIFAVNYYFNNNSIDYSESTTTELITDFNIYQP